MCIKKRTVKVKLCIKMFCCLRSCQNGSLRTRATAGMQESIHLDPMRIGPDVVLLSNNMRITGTGAALCTAPLVQSKSYFEVKIQQKGCWSVGLATEQANLSQKVGGCDQNSWCLCSDNTTRHNNEQLSPVVIPAKLKDNTNIEITNNSNDLNDDDSTVLNKFDDFLIPQNYESFPAEGDIIAVAFDHIELNFFLNGKDLDIPFRNVKGTVYPVIYVGDGAVLDIVLDNFVYAPPSGFHKIMLEQSLL